MIGKDEASTVEYLKYDRRNRSNGHSQMPDEECSSITSQDDSVTNEEMLIHVYGDNTSKKQHHKLSKLDNGYYSDGSMSPKKLLPNADTKCLHSNSSGDYIQSDVTPYFEETIALQQHTLSPLSDPNKGYSSFSLSKSSQDPQKVATNNSDSLPILADDGEYFADSMAVDHFNTSTDVTPINLGYHDYNTAVNQNNIEETIPCSCDPESVMVVHDPLADTNSFPYVALNEDFMPSINDQLGANYISHDDTKERKSISDNPPYLREVTDTSSSQELHNVYMDHGFPMQHNNTDSETATIEQTLLQKTNSETPINFGYIKECGKGVYISQ